MSGQRWFVLIVSCLLACGTQLVPSEPRVPTVAQVTEAPSNAVTELPGTLADSRTCSGVEAKDNCHHFTELIGYSVAEATKRARGAGFTGKIEVANLAEHDAGCKADTVCSVTPKRWEFNQGETLTLWINRKVTISVPE